MNFSSLPIPAEKPVLCNIHLRCTGARMTPGLLPFAPSGPASRFGFAPGESGEPGNAGIKTLCLNHLATPQ